MTTRATAEALLFDRTVDRIINADNTELPEPIMTAPSATRCRVSATYCPRCSGWVEVRLQPVRLRCTGCGLEARP
jgi:Pyruvate/2-oxoacid:ferredoxin oxidoreductase delta subunit